MKILYLEYNSYTAEYYLDSGEQYKHREFLGNLTLNELLKELGKKIDFKRKTELYLKDIPEDNEKSIKRLFNSTSIEVQSLDKKVKNHKKLI